MVDMPNSVGGFIVSPGAPVPLDRMPEHGWCVIRELDAADTDMERLMAMGVCVGRTIELVMPGDPLIIRVFGSRIGVSSRLASRVKVSPCIKRECPLSSSPGEP